MFSHVKRGPSINKDASLRSNILQFENLEDRRVLATAVLDSAGIMQVEFAVEDTQVILGSDGQYYTFGQDGNTDLNPDVDGIQSIAMKEVKGINIAGLVQKTETPQSIVFNDSIMFDGDLKITGLNHVSFEGVTHVGGDLDVMLAEDPTGQLAWLGSTDGGRVIVQGNADIELGIGNIHFDNASSEIHGQIGLVGSTLTGTNELELNSNALLDRVDLDSGLRLVAQNISNTDDAQIRIEGRTYLKGINVDLGQDRARQPDNSNIDIRLLNFKAESFFSIRDNNVLELIGKNTAPEASISTDDWLGDAGRAHLTITGHLELDAGRIMLGETETDFFSAGSISFNSPGHVHISENSSLIIQGQARAASASLIASKGIENMPGAVIEIEGHLGLQAVSDINLGRQANDHFAPGTVSFTSPKGDVMLDSDTLLHVIDAKNTARNLNMKSAGQITDDAFAAIFVEQDAVFEGELLTLGDGKSSDFQARRVNFRVAKFARIDQSTDMMLFGENSAIQAELHSQGDLMDEGGTKLDVESSTMFRAANIQLGETEDSEVNTGWLTFHSEGDIEIHENSDLILGMDNSAVNLKLVSQGMIEDRNGSNIYVKKHAELHGINIQLGDEGDRFDSETLSVMAQGEVKIEDVGNIMLKGETRVNSLHLKAANSINNAAGAIVRSNSLMQLQGVSVDLGNHENDLIASSSLNFDTFKETRVKLNRSVLLVDNNKASSVEIVAQGDILDNYDATVQVEESAMLEGFDVILGDSNADCFFVEGTVDVNAQGVEKVIVEKCSG